MQFHELKKTLNKYKKKRLGRGRSSGKGKTATRGTKGQKSRSGHRKLPAYFEGGHMPLVQRLPKLKGFKKISKIKWEVVNIEELNVFATNSEVNKKLLLEKKIIKSVNNSVKILSNGGLTKKLSVKADAFSTEAKNKIKKAGGEVIVEEKVKNNKLKESKRKKEVKK